MVKKRRLAEKGGSDERTTALAGVEDVAAVERDEGKGELAADNGDKRDWPGLVGGASGESQEPRQVGRQVAEKGNSFKINEFSPQFDQVRPKIKEISASRPAICSFLLFILLRPPPACTTATPNLHPSCHSTVAIFSCYHDEQSMRSPLLV